MTDVLPVLLDEDLARAERMQPYVSFADPLAARRGFARAVQLSRMLRGGGLTGAGRTGPAPGTGPDTVEVADRELATDGGRRVPVRVYRPRAVTGVAPVLVFLHGGGFIAGDLDTEHDRCLELAEAVGCAIVSVDYRRPPEDPFPAAVQDCLGVLEAVVAGAGELGVDPARVAVGGSSAGATIATGTALLARDRGGPALVLQLLLYPALDDRLVTPSARRYLRTTNWSVQDSEHMWRHWLGPDESARTSPYAVPARCTDFTGVAPAYVMSCELDLVRDEAIDYAARMLRDGVPVELHHYARTFHGFDLAAPWAQVSRRALAEQATALRSAFAR